MRIVRLEVENFKRLKAVAISPDGSVVQITGENGSGKSSLLDAIFCAIAGKKYTPTKPIRKGESSARITLDLGEVIVTRRFSESGETSVVVESEQGARFPSPQRMLDALFGELAFDPLAFSRTEPKARLDTLRRLVPLDVDVDALDSANQLDYERRTDVNRRAKSLTERVSTLGAGIDPSADVTRIDTAALMDEITSSADRASEIQRLRSSVADRKKIVAGNRRVAAENREKAKRLLAEATEVERIATELEGELGADEEMLTTCVVPDVAALRRQIDDANRENARRDLQAKQGENHRLASAELAELQAESTALTEAMERRSVEKRDAIARAAMPVDGLSFGQGDVLFNDLPLNQASTAEQIRVSMAIAMAANPKLRVVLIRDGSLLDAKSLAIVGEMAETHGYQVFVESVRTDSKVGVVLEAGEVTAIDGVPVTRDEPVGV